MAIATKKEMAVVPPYFEAMGCSAAERGDLIRADTAKALADALSRAYGKEITPLDIEGLNIR